MRAVALPAASTATVIFRRLRIVAVFKPIARSSKSDNQVSCGMLRTSFCNSADSRCGTMVGAHAARSRLPSFSTFSESSRKLASKDCGMAAAIRGRLMLLQLLQVACVAIPCPPLTARANLANPHRHVLKSLPKRRGPVDTPQSPQMDKACAHICPQVAFPPGPAPVTRVTCASVTCHRVPVTALPWYIQCDWWAQLFHQEM